MKVIEIVKVDDVIIEIIVTAVVGAGALLLCGVS